MTDISIVLPLYNARHLLPTVLPPLLEAVEKGDALELIVVDDNSTDDGPSYCREQGVTVLKTEERGGPGVARNVGVEAARGDVVLFIDSDVVMHADVPGIVRESFADETVGAVFGSYDDAPADRGLVSKYMNLRHHYIHQQGNEKSETFWAGCGAVDRRVFLDAGGYDADRYPLPSIEDIELGHRIRKLGKEILLRKEMLGKHLKRWTFANMIATDVFRRAVPWSRLMLRPEYKVDDLNVGAAERLKAVLAGFFWLSLAAIAWRAEAAIAAGALLALAFLANAGFFLLILRRAGIPHAIAAVFLHQLYYVYSGVVFVYCAVEGRLRPTASR